MLRASAVAERNGVPSVSIIATGFMRQAGVITRGLGLPDMAIAEYPGVPMMDSDVDFTRKIEELVYPRIVEGLSKAASTGAEPQQEDNSPERDYAASEVVFTGTLEAVNDFFYARNWSDGLPITPPTKARIEQFLAYTDRAPDEVIGSLATDNRELTVWNTAVNGVMAGCRPEYMPVLLAISDAIADPHFKVEDAGSTPGWEPMVVVSGPIARLLHIHSGQGVMRVGKIANTSIGRFTRLILRNIAGYTHAPDGADKGSIGQSFLVAAAENEDAVAEIGWQPYSVDRGFKAGDNLVTLISVVAISPPTYTGSNNASEHAELLADVFGQRTCGYWTALGMVYSNWFPLIMLGPSIARVFAKDGWTKDRIRQYFYDNVQTTPRLMERYTWNCGQTGFRVSSHAKTGLLPPEYGLSDDPDRPIPVFQKPEWIQIMVAGDWGRNQSKCYVNNHLQGMPTTKQVRLPPGWDEKYAASKSAREPQENGSSKGLMAEMKDN